MPDRFAAAAAALEKSTDNRSMTSPLLSAIPVTGASISTLGDFLGTETVSASDEVIARVDELQFDLGEGPCWDALATRRPVFEPDLRDTPRHRWPAFSEALSHEAIASIFAFPLTVGPLRIGAIDLYSRTPTALDAVQEEETARLASIVSRHILRRALESAGGDLIAEESNRFSRRTVHQATGFVIAQLGVSAEDAHLLIQGQAFAEGRTMREVAADIIERRLKFSADDNEIEDRR